MRCTKCCETKSPAEFNKRSDTGKLRSHCKTCVKAYFQHRFQENRDVFLGKTRKYYHANKDRISESNRWYWIKKRYGLSREQYEVMLAQQDGVCAICKGEGHKMQNGKRGLVVDHDHVNGDVRGLLCMRCNTYIEHFEAYHQEIYKYLGVAR